MRHCVQQLFTALDRPLFSLVQSTCATLLFPLMGLAVLPAALGLDGVWLTGLFGGALSALLAAVLLWRTMRRLEAPGGLILNFL